MEEETAKWHHPDPIQPRKPREWVIREVFPRMTVASNVRIPEFIDECGTRHYVEVIKQ